MPTLHTKQQRGLAKAIAGALVIGLLFAAARYLDSRHFSVLDPQGPIAARQRQLLGFAVVLSLAVLIPVFCLTFLIVRRYRVDAKKPGDYQPDWAGNRTLELLWWGIPGLIIIILSVVTWQSSHSLDPFQPLKTGTPPLQIQVVALQWKWLFIYPEQHMASVNYVQFPAQRPVIFTITSDAPMNSFWIPQLGGQIYTMSGMTSQLNLEADQPGNFDGVSANLSGEGFADMRFNAQATTQEAFDTWNDLVKSQSPSLSYETYQQLAKPATSPTPALYYLPDDKLFDSIIMKYAGHQPADNNQPESMRNHTTEGER